MIEIHPPPRDGDHVVQMLSLTATHGVYVDVATGLNPVELGEHVLERWRTIHPGRAFRLVKRYVRDEVVIE